MAILFFLFILLFGYFPFANYSKLKMVPYNSRAGYPHGAAEIFSLMQHMGCEPDRASYNIMVDAYGRAGLHDGNLLK